MSDIADDELLGSDELEGDYDITNETEEALLQDQDEEDYAKGRDMYDEKKDQYSDEDEDVLNLDIEEDFQDEDKYDEPTPEKENPKPIERSQKDVKAPATNPTQGNHITTKTSTETCQFNNKKPPLKTDKWKRGNFQNNRQRFMRNAVPRRRNGTVLINPRYGGTVQVRENNARLAWDHTEPNTLYSPQNTVVSPWEGPNVLPNYNPNPLVNLVTGLNQSFFEPRRSYEQPLCFEPPPNIREERNLAPYVPPSQSVAPPFVRSDQYNSQRQPDVYCTSYSDYTYNSLNKFQSYSQAPKPNINTLSTSVYNRPLTNINTQGVNTYKNTQSSNYNVPMGYSNSDYYKAQDAGYFKNQDLGYYKNQNTFKQDTGYYRNQNSDTNYYKKQGTGYYNNQATDYNKQGTQYYGNQDFKCQNYNTNQNNSYRGNGGYNGNQNVLQQRQFRRFDDEGTAPEKRAKTDNNIKVTIKSEEREEEPKHDKNEQKDTKQSEEEDEDEETRLYRQKIEEQKRERERLLKIKEERRKQMMLQRKLKDEDNLQVTPKQEPSTSQNLPTSLANHQPKNVVKPRVPIQKPNPIQVKQEDQSDVLDMTNVTFKVSNDFHAPKPAIPNTFLSNRVVLVKNQTSKKIVAPSSNPNVATASVVDSESSEQGLSSFFNNRKVLKKDNSLLSTRLVVVNNLSANFDQNKLVALSHGIGEIQKLRMDAQERQATILFKTVASAHAFFKKYQRRILDDLSVIEVKLQPML